MKLVLGRTLSNVVNDGNNDNGVDKNDANNDDKDNPASQA
jgi:hypothetical protein